MRVHPSSYRAARLYWQVPVILLGLLAAIVFSLFRGDQVIKSPKADPLINVAVLAEDLNSGQVLDGNTVTWRKLNPRHLPSGFIRSKKQLIGCKVSGPVPAHYPITPLMIEGECSALSPDASSNPGSRG